MTFENKKMLKGISILVALRNDLSGEISAHSASHSEIEKVELGFGGLNFTRRTMKRFKKKPEESVV